MNNFVSFILFANFKQKKMKKLQLILVSLSFVISFSLCAQVGIGTDEIEETAVLELKSTSKGFLLPRMTNQQRRDISSPATGLQVYVTDFEGKGVIMFYNGQEWKALTKLITCPSAPTNVQASVVTNVSGEVEITFTPPSPSENGGSDIISYTVTPILGAVTPISAQQFSAEEFNQNNKIRVTSLAIGESYTFTVTATNAIDTSLPSEASNSVELIPKVGDFYQGGVVFYLLNGDDPNHVYGQIRGLICALEDLDSEIQWSPDGVAQEVTGTLENMDRGKFNTDKIIVKFPGNQNYAAYQATTYRGGNYDDWYLPSIHELNKMYDERVTINPILESNDGRVFINDYYWSSSEKGTQAWRYNFSNGLLTGGEKSNTYLVRPVRSF